jgi:hypothetical protein
MEWRSIDNFDTFTGIALTPPYLVMITTLYYSQIKIVSTTRHLMFQMNAMSISKEI